MHVPIAIRLEPVLAIKPRIAIDAAAEVARRIGCHVVIEINGATVRIGPTTTRSTAFEAWSAAKTEADAGAQNGAAERT
jgi:hypothetical protein